MLTKMYLSILILLVALHQHHSFLSVMSRLKEPQARMSSIDFPFRFRWKLPCPVSIPHPAVNLMVVLQQKSREELPRIVTNGPMEKPRRRSATLMQGLIRSQ